MKTNTCPPTQNPFAPYWAAVTKDPLTRAFDENRMVHPGSQGFRVPEADRQPLFAELMEKERTGKTVAYIHVPFCETHCLYCGFYRKKYNAGQSREYADTLIRELGFYKDTPGQSADPVHAVYFGGGTPTALEAEDLSRIIAAVGDALPLANDCEITVEGRITNFGPEKMKACMDAGANRFSLGVQTFDTELRQRMNRRATREEAVASLETLLAFDQAAVVIDLIYGFPAQTREMWQKDLETLKDLELDGVDLYQLKVFKGTPLFAAIEKKKSPEALDLPTRARRFAMGAEFLAREQYRRISANHWARTSRERNLYNAMAKTTAHCLGFGPGAGGNFQGHFYFLESGYEKWRTRVERGEKPIAMMQKQPRFSPVFKTITSQLELCRIHLDRVGRQFNLPVKDALAPVYDQWHRAGLMKEKNGWHTLTLAGQYWQPSLAQRSIDCLHSQLTKEIN